jgi:hypothetical protein
MLQLQGNIDYNGRLLAAPNACGAVEARCVARVLEACIRVADRPCDACLSKVLFPQTSKFKQYDFHSRNDEV